MSVALAKYNEAKRALSVAVNIDEVKDIRDKAEAMRLYALQAKDRVLIDQATEIRMRAERRAGELLRDLEKNKGARGSGSNQHELRSHDATTPRLADLGLNKSQSSRWQQLAGIARDDFEDLVAKAQQKASAAVDRAQQPKPKSKPKPKPKPKSMQPIKRGTLDIIAACVSEFEEIVRAAISGMDLEERRGLSAQLTTSLHEIMAAAALQEAKVVGAAPDLDRWVEA